ncbi:MAG: BREX-4 system phosphatase PglZ [Firmicutes bacterium]|nr:BREX-4 system phosphatase PglZ [Bacillota bacterium]
MFIKIIKDYLNSEINSPFFIAVGNDEYSQIKTSLVDLGFVVLRLSTFCKSNDKLPNIDDLLDYLKDIDDESEVVSKIAVIGLGEYLGLCGNNKTEKVLARIKDYNLGRTKAVLLLRGITSNLIKLKSDPRMDRRKIFINDNKPCRLNITLISPFVNLIALEGIKPLLERLEDGENDNLIVKTQMNMENSIFNIYNIETSYGGINYIINDFKIESDYGTDRQWAELLNELEVSGGSLNAVLEKYGLSENLESDFFNKITGFEFKNWLYFIALKCSIDMLSNTYLKYVLKNTVSFEDFKTDVLNAIIDIHHTDNQFVEFYNDRKTLIKRFKEPDIASFVVNNRKYIEEGIYKLTDNTITEKEEIIAWIVRRGIISEIEYIYPALYSYLKNYVFNCGDLSDMLTEYFSLYKYQKVINIIEPNFLEKVEKLAITRDYNRLRTRNEVLDSINNEDTYLCWVDALGVEYLSYITDLAKKRGLVASINIARAELPTITSINKDFFENWLGKKEKVSELDEIKHKEKGGYNFENNALPIHLAKELDVIEEVIDKAATELALRNYKSYLIVSDHGASRLAVLHRKEEKYETETEGRHSGRCCKTFETYDLPFAAEENGYLVLADYGRFKGSRRANVEVHGGASLEEVLIPIIELTLREKEIIVEMVEETVMVDYRACMEITLYFNYPLLKNVSVIINSKRYSSEAISDNHFKIVFPDIKRAGTYDAEVYEGDNFIDNITIKAHGKSGKINDVFDDLF